MQTDNPAIARQFERFGPSYRWLVTACGMMGSMTMVLSSTIVNVSIPSIMGAFGVGQDLAQWASTAFLTTMVASQLLNSWTSRVIGPRNTYLMALVIFSIGAVLSAISPSIEVLIAGRILQGFSAGLVQPLALATAVAVFPPERRGLAVGTVGMGIALAPTFGPLVGGITIDLVTWRHVFIVPLPLVGLSAIMALNLMPARNPLDKKPSFDWIGFILLCTALTTLMAGIGNGQRWGWESLHFLIFLLVGLASAVLFVVTQLRSKNPLLDPTLFLDARFASAVAVAFAFGVGNFSTNYSIPLFTQTIQGYTATKAGLVLVPAGLLLVALMQASGRLADRVPPHWPIIVGCSSFAVAAMVLATIDVNTAFITVALLAMFTRGSMSLISPNMGKAALSAVPAEKMAQGAGTFNFFRQMGGAFGVNMTAVTIEMRTAYHADFLTATQTNVKGPTAEMLDRVRELLNAAGVPSPADGAMALDYLGRVVYAQANTFAFHDSFRQIAVIFALTVIPAIVLGRSRSNSNL
ncbi:MAG: MFS transporter [Rhodospirillaceae bacterium]|nr:MFS transporter [Rhodospirillaceae bacterium]